MSDRGRRRLGRLAHHVSIHNPTSTSGVSTDLPAAAAAAAAAATTTTTTTTTRMNIVYSPEVEECLISKGGVARIVALESTIVSHGMPFPQNYDMARAVEAIIREHGAVPATICILGGTIHVGLTDQELRYLATNRIAKVSRRDVAATLALGLDGATTVASTMLLADLVGIRVFVTGGIGGVHKSYAETMDVSADLVELGRTPVTVVCAGVKSILDIPRTLEFLETQGVCVAAYKTDDFPAFYFPKSGSRVRRMDSVADVAACIKYNVEVTGSGMVLGVPMPASFDTAMTETNIKQSIEQALKEAKERNMTGSKETPYVLQRVQELTGGESLARNIALVKHNAVIGAGIAVELHSQVME